MSTENGFALVIERWHPLADTVADCLRQRGFEVVVATTHAGAAALALECPPVDFLVAAVPAPGEGHDGAYLAKARKKSPGVGVVVMVSDSGEPVNDAPPAAVRIVKPFDRSELEAAIDRALVCV
jgi:DNA-binding response OmpR family regulator